MGDLGVLGIEAQVTGGLTMHLLAPGTAIGSLSDPGIERPEQPTRSKERQGLRALSCLVEFNEIFTCRAGGCATLGKSTRVARQDREAEKRRACAASFWFCQ